MKNKAFCILLDSLYSPTYTSCYHLTHIIGLLISSSYIPFDCLDAIVIRYAEPAFTDMYISMLGICHLSRALWAIFQWTALLNSLGINNSFRSELCFYLLVICWHKISVGLGIWCTCTLQVLSKPPNMYFNRMVLYFKVSCKSCSALSRFHVMRSWFLMIREDIKISFLGCCINDFP